MFDIMQILSQITSTFHHKESIEKLDRMNAGTNTQKEKVKGRQKRKRKTNRQKERERES